jgi:hypothetical protein
VVAYRLICAMNGIAWPISKEKLKPLISKNVMELRRRFSSLH